MKRLYTVLIEPSKFDYLPTNYVSGKSVYAENEQDALDQFCEDTGWTNLTLDHVDVYEPLKYFQNNFQ